jgi:hypothetical protein
MAPPPNPQFCPFSGADHTKLDTPFCGICGSPKANGQGPSTSIEEAGASSSSSQIRIRKAASVPSLPHAIATPASYTPTPPASRANLGIKTGHGEFFRQRHMKQSSAQTPIYAAPTQFKLLAKVSWAIIPDDLVSPSTAYDWTNPDFKWSVTLANDEFNSFQLQQSILKQGRNAARHIPLYDRLLWPRPIGNWALAPNHLDQKKPAPILIPEWDKPMSVECFLAGHGFQKDKKELESWPITLLFIPNHEMPPGSSISWLDEVEDVIQTSITPKKGTAEGGKAGGEDDATLGGKDKGKEPAQDTIDDAPTGGFSHKRQISEASREHLGAQTRARARAKQAE